MEICARMRTNTSSVSLGGEGDFDAAADPMWYMQHNRGPGRHQAQFPGVSSSCMSCAYLLRDSDCSLLPAMAASSFAGGGKQSR